MSGTKFNVTVDGRDVQAMLNRLAASVGNPTPLLAELGSILEQSTRDRFGTAIDPSGQPWAQLSDVTKARKRNPRILVESGDLLKSILFETGPNFVELIAGPTSYAATQQFGRADNRFFGGPLAPIPARPFLGVSASDAVEIDDAVQSFLDDVTR